MNQNATPERGSRPKWDLQRMLLGLLAVASISLGLFLWSRQDDSLIFYAATCNRAGLLMAAIWLAWPTLGFFRNRASSLAIGGVIALLAVVATRPKIFPMVAAILILGLFINGAMRRLSGKLPGR